MTSHVVLVGMMGAGKSTVGELLAERLGRPFVDVDRSIERDVGMSVAELFAARGEAAFRRLESDALGTALGSDAPAVVATGGGALLDPANRTVVGSHLVVWLRAAPEVLAARVGSGDDRPLLADSGEDGALGERLRSIAEARHGTYEEVAEVVVDVDALAPEAVADQLASQIDAAATSGAEPERGAGR